MAYPSALQTLIRLSGTCALALGLAAPLVAGVLPSAADVADPDQRELAVQLDGAGALPAAARLVNARVALSQTVQLRFASCEDANAWYEPSRREVRLCLPLAQQMAGLLAAQLDDEAQMLEALDGALRFIALHELGHALVDQLRLPITGREEDAVDQLAAWLLLADGDSGSLLSAASVFAAQISGGEDVAAAHSLDRQRYFNLLCWVYGSDPASRPSLLEDWQLPAERAAGCSEEYAQLGRSWERLLAPHAQRPAPQPIAATDLQTPTQLPAAQQDDPPIDGATAAEQDTTKEQMPPAAEAGRDPPRQ